MNGVSKKRHSRDGEIDRKLSDYKEGWEKSKCSKKVLQSIVRSIRVERMNHNAGSSIEYFSVNETESIIQMVFFWIVQHYTPYDLPYSLVSLFLSLTHTNVYRYTIIYIYIDKRNDSYYQQPIYCVQLF